MQMTHSAHTAALEGQEDQYLLSQVARQERAAFEVLYRRYYRRVYYFVSRLVRRDDVAEEVVSDVMFAVWKGAASFAGGSSVSTWLLGIAYRQAMKAMDRNRRHSRADGDDETLKQIVDAHPATDPESAAIIRDGDARLQQAISALADHHRVVVELTAMGHSYGEIAEVVGCPENTVKTRMFHARQLLKRFLAQFGDNHTQAGSDRLWTPSIHQG